MLLIFQGALIYCSYFPAGSSFIAAETSAEARGIFELCGLGLEAGSKSFEGINGIMIYYYYYYSCVEFGRLGCTRFIFIKEVPCEPRHFGSSAMSQKWHLNFGSDHGVADLCPPLWDQTLARCSCYRTIWS